MVSIGALGPLFESRSGRCAVLLFVPAWSEQEAVVGGRGRRGSRSRVQPSPLPTTARNDGVDLRRTYEHRTCREPVRGQPHPVPEVSPSPPPPHSLHLTPSPRRSESRQPSSRLTEFYSFRPACTRMKTRPSRWETEQPFPLLTCTLTLSRRCCQISSKEHRYLTSVSPSSGS